MGRIIEMSRSGAGTINWTPNAIEFLRHNYGKISAAEIVERIGTGHSRTAIIGKARRLGLKSDIVGGNWAKGKYHIRSEVRPHVPKKREPSNGRPTLQPTLEQRLERKVKIAEYEEPDMPVLEGDAKLHSRQHRDLEPGMCQWPVYFEQGVQMYCACNTERLPGRFSTYCKTHKLASEVPQSERRSRYRGKVWGG